MSTYTTENEGQGFHGTIQGGVIAQRLIAALYDQAATTLVEMRLLASDEAVAFLDSRMGRHLADRISHGKNASEIEALIRQHGADCVEHYRASN